jgi:hypothetical protein
MPDDTELSFIGKKEWELCERIADHIAQAPGECLEWDGCVNQSGTPYMKFRGRRIITVRRLIYAWKLNGFPSLPWTGDNLYTTCGNLRCINPNHIRVGG